MAELTNGAAYGEPQNKHPTAVTIKEGIVVLNVNSNRKSVSHGFLAGIFGVLDRFGVVVDLISTSEVHVSMAIEQGIEKRALDKVVRELSKYGSVSCYFFSFLPPSFYVASSGSLLQPPFSKKILFFFRWEN